MHILTAKNATSISRMIGDEFTAKIVQEERYQQAHRQALADLNAGFHFGGKGIQSRNALLDRIHRNEATEEHRLPALLQAGQVRFRPILLTTLTTFLGLMPILWEQGAEAERVIPLAVTLAFGVLFSTLVTLMLVPVGYLIFADIQRGIRRWGKMGLPLIL
ncbi:efflux RND transporter permease subunit [Nitrosococcus wardiae]|uniref:Efflux RND transporter permease subunit n=1 Tax=Nitrosococcus wardiae TaxID=1814290 RepID=A0A4P7C301_9GAMM|nr:efflux RND transporter permease subunit [Nitrosococcus wardiae]QBQ55256.1 efflux RND transporter permease subunit [Nitrosococcus wardiae]